VGHLARRHRGFDARCRAHRRRTRRVRRASIVGIDPFTQREQTLLSPMATGAASTLAYRGRNSPISRAPSFGCSVRSQSASEPAKLVVYYLGIPDTTPEFTSEAALEAYLAARMSQGARKP
jgi:hypothetical protein